MNGNISNISLPHMVSNAIISCKKILEFPMSEWHLFVALSFYLLFCHSHFLKSHRYAFRKKRERTKLFGFKSQLNMSVALFSTYSKKLSHYF